MALPLKSGADLYNQQALRLRLHNLGADPLEVGEGLIYYNTSTGLNTSGKARIYTGAGWKTLAFSEDLDVASNAEFIALKEKVDLLAGDVDTDAIISNMKEVAAFLDGFAEDADLMTYLTTELGKKLDKTGGTLTSLLLLEYTNPRIAFKSDANTTLGAVGFKDGVLSANITADNKWYTLIHSGNVGEYALKLDGSNARATMLTSSQNLDDYQYGFYSYTNGKNPTNSFGDNTALFAFASNRGNDIWQIAFDGNGITNTEGPRFGIRGNFSGQGWTSWYRIATTESNVASATKLETPRTIWGQSFDGTGNVSGSVKHTNGWSFIDPSDNNVIFGYDYAHNNKPTYIDGKEIYLRYGTGHTNGLILNSSGGVTIGDADKIGTSNTRLWVDGHARFNADAYLTNWAYLRTYLADGTEHSLIGVNNNNILYINDGTTVPTIIRGGNVGIGTDPSEKLSVAGNITATGEISCGGAGEEGVGGGGASVFQHVFTPSASASVRVLHNLGTEDIVITLYEKDATSGLWSVCLTDIEIVSANEVTITFGSTSSQEHKVVIMGGAA